MPANVHHNDFSLSKKEENIFIEDSIFSVLVYSLILAAIQSLCVGLVSMYFSAIFNLQQGHD